MPSVRTVLASEMPPLAVSRSTSLPSPIRLAPGWAPRLAYGLLLAVLSSAAVFLTAGADPASRAAGLRLWTLAGAGLFAVAPPNVLFPDPNVPLVQLLNWSPSRLLRYQGRRMAFLLMLVALPVLLGAYADPAGPLRHLAQKSAAAGQALVLLLGIALDCFVHFASIGVRSQAWHEGQSGQWYATAVDEMGQGIDLPRGLVPALYATARCFTVALTALIISAAGAQSGSVALAWSPGLLLLGWGVARLWRRRTAFDRHFYQTTALYDEVLGGTTAAATDRAPVPYDALYWVPARWRPATWASLRQLDRRLPLGRLVGVAHLGLWVLCLRDVIPAVVSGYLLVVLIGQVAACKLLATPTTAPRPFQRILQSTVDWIVTRTLVNLRWLVPHAGSLALVALFDDTYGLPWVLTWAAVHGVLSVGAAVVVTPSHGGRPRRTAV